MIISERIFCILNEKGMSQKTFSEKTGIAQSTISDWKRKKTNPAADKIMVICSVLDVSVYELLGDTECKGTQQKDYVVIGKDSEEYALLESYHSLQTNDKAKLLGYMDALKNKLD
ncbi:MAG: helix-turn-helix transcriptional regulator [Lachnospiraceae bacterium]|nr:helix-turn-helix transcriptional regulator [Lachnospiraceae bacterium]